MVVCTSVNISLQVALLCLVAVWPGCVIGLSNSRPHGCLVIHISQYENIQSANNIINIIRPLSTLETTQVCVRMKSANGSVCPLRAFPPQQWTEQTGSSATTCERFNVIGRAVKVISTSAAVCYRHHHWVVKGRKTAAAVHIDSTRHNACCSRMMQSAQKALS